MSARTRTSRTKAALVALLARLPLSWWPAAGRLVRRLWPGFRHA
jgi:hypothetical protein